MTVSNPSPTSAHLRVASSSATRPVAVDVERIERIEVDVDVALVVQLRTPCEEGREGGLVSEGVDVREYCVVRRLLSKTVVVREADHSPTPSLPP